MVYQKDNLDNWDNYIINFLKTDQVIGDEQAFIVVNVSENLQGESLKPRLTLEHGQEQFEFDLNATNSRYCKNAGIRNPRMLIGKKVYFEKVKAINPKTKQTVDSLRIRKIE